MKRLQAKFSHKFILNYYGSIEPLGDPKWKLIGFLNGVNNDSKGKELSKWFDKGLDFIKKPPFNYDESFSECVMPMVRRIVVNEGGAIDDFSIERLYEEFTKELPDDIMLKIEKSNDPIAEKVIYISKKFIKQL